MECMSCLHRCVRNAESSGSGIVRTGVHSLRRSKREGEECSIYSQWGHRSASSHRHRRKTMDEATGADLPAWLDHNVMVVRDQDLHIPDFIAIATLWAGDAAPVEIDAASGASKITLLGVDKFDADGKLRER